MLFALMVGATSEAQTTLEKSNIIIDGGTRDGETFEYTVDHGSVTVKDIDADTRKVTLTIAPAIGYCIQKSDILVQKLADPAEAAAPRRVPDFTDPLVVSGPVMSKAADYTFVVPDGYAGALVKVSFTELTVATAVVNPNTLVYTGEAQELVTLGTVVGTKFDDGTVLAEHTSLAGYYMKSDNNYSPCSTSDEANGTTKYYKPIVTYKVEGPYDSGTVLGAGTSLNGYYTKTDDGYIACNSNTTADGTTTYYQRRESFSTDEVFAADNRLKTDAGNYVVYYKVASDNNHADGSGSVLVTMHPARLTEVTLTKSADEHTGSELTFEPKQVKAGTIIVQPADYDVSGNTNTAEGNYILTVTGKGNYTGTVTANYMITPAGTIVIDGSTTSDDITNSAGTYILAADVSASVFSNISSGTFTGTLDGNYHTISGLSKALFNTIEDGTVKNVMLKNVHINQSGNVGAITGEAKGYTRIYNCGILPNDNTFSNRVRHSSVASTDGYCGGLVGWLKDDSRVINCFSYANVNGGTDVAGIVGHNEEVYKEEGISYGSTTHTSGGKYYRLKTAVVNCMFYGNITGGTNRYPVYGGAMMRNDIDNGINNYDFYRAEANLGLADDSHYNCSWPAPEDYLTHYEFYRSLLNSNRELCGWWVGAESAPSTMEIADVQKVRKNASLMAKWVLDPSIAPYPILKSPGFYPSIVNQAPKPGEISSQRIDSNTKQWVNRASSSTTWTNPKNAPETEGQTLGIINVTIKKNSSDTGVGKTFTITAMDIINKDFCYGKIQLPYYNSIFGDPTVQINAATDEGKQEQWNQRYGGNYNDDVVVGWKITSVTGGITGITDSKKEENGKVIYDHKFSTDAESGYNFADRYCTTKDKSGSENGGRVFAQGGYYYVPYGVTDITIEAKWAKAIYLDNSADHDYDRVRMSSSGNTGQRFFPAGTRSTTLPNGQSVVTGTINANIPKDGSVYENAIVLVGNHQYRKGGGDVGRFVNNAIDKTSGCTIMSADFDLDEEPDYCLIWQLGTGTTRASICPIRFDFLPVVEIGLAMKQNASTQYYSLGCYRPLGHFEMTETSLIHFGQFEFSNKNRSKYAPLILNGGIFDQYTKGTNNNAFSTADDKIDYIILGGNVRMPSFTPGAHVNPNSGFPTRHCPVNAIGGNIDNLYLTGNYHDNVKPNNDNPHCYIDGGNFKQVAAAGKEGIDGNVIFKVNHSVIQEFYGGSTLGDKYVTGSIDVTIDNSYVTKYCGGPKFSNLAPSDINSVTTNATGTTFGVYYGGGNGGTSYMQYDKADATVTDATPGGTFISWDDATANRGGRLKYYTPPTYRSSAPIGYHADYEMEIVNTSTGEDSKKAIFRTYMFVAQFSATDTGPITNNLTDCKVLTNFYGGGNLGGVQGDVTSTLSGATRVEGSVFAAGYSASVPEVTIYNKDKTPPTINVYTGIITPESGGTSTTYTWTNKTNINGTTLSTSSPTATDTDGKKYLYTEEPLTNLGMVTGKATLNIEGTTTVGGSVYGGGEESGVDGNTEVKVTGGTIGTAGKGGADYGNVYGGGKGKNDNVMAGLVKGNTNVEISGSPTIYHNVYGGGAYGSVGEFTYDATSGMPTARKENTTGGVCNVTITGGTFGWNGKENGMIFGSSRGDVGAPNNIEDKMAWVYDTDVKIGTSGSGSVFTTPTIRGSVYGGGENGHNLNNAAVHIYSGTIGVPTGDNVVVPNGDNTSTTYEAYNYPYRGNVYGGGCGTDTYWIDANNDKTVDEGEKHYNPLAGIVRGNAIVNISGGHIVHNVYGAGAMGSVGNASDATSGKTTINISGGRIGSDGSRNGNVFGAARGEYGIEQTLANVRQSEVNINYATTATGDNEDKTVQLIAGSVFGGGEAGTVKGSVAVNMIGGLILKDIYGGGALAHTQTDNWDSTKNDNAGGWAEGKSSASNTTFVNLLGGTIAGEAYGGGLGEAGKPAYVYGDTKVNLNGMDRSEYKDAYAAILQLVDGNNDDDTDDTDEDYYRVKQDVRGCVVHQVFGCNNINGTPMGESKVHVFATQNKNTENIGSRLTFTEPTTDKETYWSELATTYGMNPATIIGDATTDEAKINLLKAAVEASRYDVLAVYGGGNLSAYEPVKALSADETTKASAHTNVIIDGCGFTSIQQVYGGGNAASTPATNLTINGTYEIEEAFGGGNGKDDLPNGDPNPGANVGFHAYADNATNAQTPKDRADNYGYGSGKASLNIYGGTIHRVFGGSNTKGNVRQTAVTMLEEVGGCDFCVDEAYGGGKSAPMDAEAKLLMACIPGLNAAYGGAEAADIQGNVSLTITNGRFSRVFGGNNLSGTIRGAIKVNVEEVGCKPIIIGELYGGGNEAGYSIYGYKQKTEGGKLVWKPRESASDNTADGECDNLTTPYADPQVNVKSFTSIGAVYGGGYGKTAVMVGNPTVNVSVVEGAWKEYVGESSQYEVEGYVYDATGYKGETITITDSDGTTTHDVELPNHAKGKIGAIGQVFGGGNAAPVKGNTTVNIGTLEKVSVKSYVEKTVDAGASLEGLGLYTRSGAGTIASPYRYIAATGTAEEGTKYYEEKDVETDVVGVDIRGNVYGGGNNAEVTGNTNVQIGKKM